MEVPQVSGERLALVTGSGLAGQLIDDIDETLHLTVPARDGGTATVVVHDCGGYLLLRRHGDATSVPAHLVDHHANVAALCAAGANRVLGLASVGGLHPQFGVGVVVAPDDFFALDSFPTFYADTRGHHIPGFDLEWRKQVVNAWEAATETPLADGGVYAESRGPRFESPAEVRFFATVADVVGMTLASECILAREAGLAYASLCKIDNLGNGLDADPLTMAEYHANTEATRAEWLADLRATLTALVGPS